MCRRGNLRVIYCFGEMDALDIRLLTGVSLVCKLTCEGAACELIAKFDGTALEGSEVSVA